MIRETVYPNTELPVGANAELTPEQISEITEKVREYYKNVDVSKELKRVSKRMDEIRNAPENIDPNPFNYSRWDALDGTGKVYYVHREMGYTIPESTYRSLVNRKEWKYFKEPSDVEEVIRKAKENTKAKSADMVNHPPHYNVNGFEVIDIIEAFTADLTGIEAVDTANAIKYILRWKHKNGVEDLEKARWYINHLIKTIKETK